MIRLEARTRSVIIVRWRMTCFVTTWRIYQWSFEWSLRQIWILALDLHSTMLTSNGWTGTPFIETLSILSSNTDIISGRCTVFMPEFVARITLNNSSSSKKRVIVRTRSVQRATISYCSCPYKLPIFHLSSLMFFRTASSSSYIILLIPAPSWTWFRRSVVEVPIQSWRFQVRIFEVLTLSARLDMLEDESLALV